MRYGFNGMAKIGKATENLFAKYAPKIGWTRNEKGESGALDIFFHIDQVYIDKDGNEIKVQIKDMRHEYQGGPPITDAIVVELLNVNGNEGSFRGGHSAYVYRLDDCFLIYKSFDIRKAVEKLIDFSKQSTTFKNARLIPYTRRGRNDSVSLIPILDLVEMGINPVYKIILSNKDTKTINEFYYKCVAEAKARR